ncbi:phage major capsid protein [Mycolicibacterium celeriflavum]|uniref:Phage capsid-like C-terminal domain-containing protein n=1 Tax=Mycolicibacterium celeriflavum TaxID=1249101 RepID=A0A1X0BKY4_MYCCF|nr:phage major capsid protein [Mycolicibacterium celeriflavum]MCV7236550.1 phage major capsid protein [Mycolicibacterium celeriflavum]ORA43049.1 hypothetical protein BST21_22490 [Mycolicibacterium celeriflavum]BBY41807.1 hypothetical protein MCEL_01020 [Mycolicibacterium celeriflavum]
MSYNDKIARLQKLRNEATAKRRAITDRVEREQRADLSENEAAAFTSLTKSVRDIEDQIEQLRDDATRAGHDNPDVIAIAQAVARVDDSRTGHGWAHRAADAIHKANRFDGEKRAITASSIDIPTLVQPNVVPMDRPGRIIDLLVDRQTVQSNAYEFWRQTTRTNNADVVADAAEKPVSVFTVTPIEDRVRVVAHLSQPVANRLFFDHQELRTWLDSELREGLLDALEAQVVSGSGTGEDMSGILTVAGTTAVPFDTSVPVTLRGALATAQTAGTMVNGWVLNPADVADLDLLLETSGSGYLLDGYTNTNTRSANVLGGPDIARVVSPSVPVGTALLADWSKARTYVREDVRIDLDPFTHFSTNQTVVRAEMRVGFAVLRPEAFYVVDLTA